MLLFYLRKEAVTKLKYFSKIYYHTTFQDLVLNGTSAIPNSLVCKVAGHSGIIEGRILERTKLG
jgi:hypothetical protein